MEPTISAQLQDLSNNGKKNTYDNRITITEARVMDTGEESSVNACGHQDCEEIVAYVWQVFLKLDLFNVGWVVLLNINLRNWRHIGRQI